MITLINYTNVKQIVETLMASPIIDQIKNWYIKNRMVALAALLPQNAKANNSLLTLHTLSSDKNTPHYHLPTVAAHPILLASHTHTHTPIKMTGNSSIRFLCGLTFSLLGYTQSDNNSNMWVRVKG